MKTLFKFTLVIALLFSTVANATNESPIKAKKTTVFSLSYVESGTKLALRDVFGSTLYTENIEKNGEYNKGFDLTSLPIGRYFFELTHNDELKRYPIWVSERSVKINFKAEEVAYEPSVVSRKNLLYISQVSNSIVAMKVFIYAIDKDNKEVLVKRDWLKDNETAGRIYKLNKKKATKYKVVIKTRQHKDYIKTIDLE